MECRKPIFRLQLGFRRQPQGLLSLLTGSRPMDSTTVSLPAMNYYYYYYYHIKDNRDILCEFCVKSGREDNTGSHETRNLNCANKNEQC